MEEVADATIFDANAMTFVAETGSTAPVCGIGCAWTKGGLGEFQEIGYKRRRR